MAWQDDFKTIVSGVTNVLTATTGTVNAVTGQTPPLAATTQDGSKAQTAEGTTASKVNNGMEGGTVLLLIGGAVLLLFLMR